MIKKILIAILVMLAIGSCIPKQWMIAEAADILGTDWYVVDGQSIAMVHFSCSFSPCASTGGNTTLSDIDGENSTTLPGWELDGDIIRVGDLFVGVVSRDGMMIVGSTADKTFTLIRQ
jgi:hypothetical protein